MRRVHTVDFDRIAPVIFFDQNESSNRIVGLVLPMTG